MRGLSQVSTAPQFLIGMAPSLGLFLSGGGHIWLVDSVNHTAYSLAHPVSRAEVARQIQSLPVSAIDGALAPGRLTHLILCATLRDGP